MSNSNQTTVQATHSRRATVEARKALHWHGFSVVERDAKDAVLRHATLAGQYASYSGVALPAWRVLLETELAVPGASEAFELSYHTHTDLLSTPDSDLE